MLVVLDLRDRRRDTTRLLGEERESRVLTEILERPRTQIVDSSDHLRRQPPFDHTAHQLGCRKIVVGSMTPEALPHIVFQFDVGRDELFCHLSIIGVCDGHLQVVVLDVGKFVLSEGVSRNLFRPCPTTTRHPHGTGPPRPCHQLLPAPGRLDTIFARRPLTGGVGVGTMFL